MTKMMTMATMATVMLLMAPALAQASADPAAPEVPQGASLSPPPVGMETAVPPADTAPSAGTDPMVPPAGAAPVSPPDTAAAQPATPAPDIAVIDQSLVSMMTENGALTSTPTDNMPYAVGTSCYHWAVKYTPVEGEVTLTEELRLPGPARNWDFTGTDTVVNPQGSGAITTRRFNGSTGGATAGWCVAKDDPMGSYRYIIRQGEREIARFDFTVGELL